jgi:hypothetical protein
MARGPSLRVVTAAIPMVRAILLPAVESKAPWRIPSVPIARMRLSITIPEAARPAARLTHGELGGGSCRRLPIGPGEGGPDQLAMDRTFLFWPGDGFVRLIGLGCDLRNLR